MQIVCMKNPSLQRKSRCDKMTYFRRTRGFLFTYKTNFRR